MHLFCYTIFIAYVALDFHGDCVPRSNREFQRCSSLEKDQTEALETVPCNLCGSRRYTPVYEMPDARHFFPEYFTVVECDECGLGFVNPRPDRNEIQKYYPQGYYQNENSESFASYLQKRFTQQALYLQELENRPGPRKLLDVGCFNGEFPRFMAARGWDVSGVEISEVSQRITDFPVFTQEFNEIPVHAPTYDAVTAWAVLEHVHDPMSYFQKAAQVLKPGGLFVFQMPNFVSTSSRHLFWEDVPRHLYFYTRETVAQYLQKTGLILQSEDNRGNVYKSTPSGWLSYMIRTKLQRQPFTYKDRPLTSKEFRLVHQLPRGVAADLKYLAYSPLSVFERLLFPAIEAIQLRRKTYGSSTYVARKS
jgi:2-polyprenyl-3-methyl-5-hydroxy-6-metoxy-1,4-benzoquinol methylase